MDFDSEVRTIVVSHEVVDGLDEQEVADWFATGVRGTPKTGFVEGYRPRANLSPDREMQAGVTRMCDATGFKSLDNMGAKAVITPGVMQALGVWSWRTSTHHQDLRSAARIALFGFVKTPEGNRLIADIIRDHLNHKPWDIQAN
jgi:hypothetical protein